MTDSGEAHTSNSGTGPGHIPSGDPFGSRSNCRPVGGAPNVPLGEVVKINPRPDRDLLDEDQLASFLPMKCVEEETGRFEPASERKVRDVKNGYTAFRNGDVLLAKVTPCMENGKAAVMSGLTNGIGFGSTEFFVMRPTQRLDASYLLHFVLQATFRRLAALNMTGAVGLRRVPKPFLEEQPIPLPPLEEQRRIVAEIEKQFTRLDAGTAALRYVEAKLKRYRAAVLNAACEGRLVPNRGKWQQIAFKDLIGKISQGWSPKCDMTREPLPDEWAVVTTTAIQSMRYIDTQAKPLPATRSARPHLEIKVGDFLMTRKGPRKRAGVSCLVRETRSRSMICDTVYRFRCDESLVVPPYLELALNSPAVVEAIDRQKAGINESGVSLTHDRLGVVSIPVPPIEEQNQIVAEVERRLSFLEELEATVSANLERAARLRQSILQKAFAGELV